MMNDNTQIGWLSPWRNVAGVSDDKKKMKNDVKVRTGDAAMYGDNVSENLHTTSKNEVKKISSISWTSNTCATSCSIFFA